MRNAASHPSRRVSELSRALCFGLPIGSELRLTTRLVGSVRCPPLLLEGQSTCDERNDERDADT